MGPSYGERKNKAEVALPQPGQARRGAGGARSPAGPRPSPLLPPPLVTGEGSYPRSGKRRDPPAGSASPPLSSAGSGGPQPTAPLRGTRARSQPASIFSPHLTKKRSRGANAAAGGFSPSPGAADRSRGPRATLRGAGGGGPGRGTHLRQNGGATAEAAAGLGELGPAVAAAAAVPAGGGGWRRLMDPELAGPAAVALLALRLPAERGGRAA